MTLVHRAGSSVAEHWSAVRRVHFEHCQSSSAECDIWGRGQDPPAERAYAGMRFEESSKEVEIGEAIK